MIYLQLIAMVLIWSFSFIIVDIGLEFITPMALALHRFVLASLIFILIRIYLYLSNSNRETKNNIPNNEILILSKPQILLVITASFSGISLFFFSQYSAIQIIGPSLPALFVCLLSSVLISILALIFFKEKLNKFKIIGFFIASIGGFLLITAGDISVLFPQSENFLGYFYALLTPFLSFIMRENSPL